MVAPSPVGRLLCLLVYRERQELALEILRQDEFATDCWEELDPILSR